jgi:hypothetical protein
VELILFWYLQSLNKPITISQNKNRLYLVGDDFYFILRVFKLSKCLDWWLLNWSLGRRRAEKELPSSSNPAINKKKNEVESIWLNLKKQRGNCWCFYHFCEEEDEKSRKGDLLNLLLCSLYVFTVFSIYIHRFLRSSEFSPETSLIESERVLSKNNFVLN